MLCAGVERIELPVERLECSGLPLTDTPMREPDEICTRFHAFLAYHTTKKTPKTRVFSADK